MGAVFGIVDLEGKQIDASSFERMEALYREYVLDAITVNQSDGYCVGTGHLFVTEEDRLGPAFVEAQKGVLFVGDVILDNRVELAEDALKGVDLTMCSDIEVISKLYGLYGSDLSDYIYGDFSIVIIDLSRNEVCMIRDHVGKRSLFYRVKDSVLMFSTTLKGMIEGLGGEGSLKLDESWFAGAIGMPGNGHDVDAYHTVVDGVYHCPPGTVLTFKDGQVDEHYYWQLEKWGEARLPKSKDEDVYSAFLDLYTRCVDDKLRGTGKVGILQSSGLDSGTVAAIAARKLNRTGQVLHGYNLIPTDDYKDWVAAGRYADERKMLRPLLSMYPNIEMTYVQINEDSALSVIDESLDMYAQPYKFVSNNPWLIRITEAASKDDVKVLLDGQYGNLSVSYGRSDYEIMKLLIKGRFARAFKEFNLYCRRVHIGRKKMAKYILKNIWGSLTYKEAGKYADVLLAKDAEKKYGINDKLMAIGYSLKPYMGPKRMKKAMLQQNMLNHLGMVDTVLGLRYGLVKRDPTRDARLMEYVRCLGEGIFLNNGYDRALVRIAFKGLLPDSIRLNVRSKGIQAADWMQRIENEWDSFSDGLEQDVMTNEILGQLVDSDELKKAIAISREVKYNNDKSIKTRKLISLHIMLLYINRYREARRRENE